MCSLPNSAACREHSFSTSCSSLCWVHALLFWFALATLGTAPTYASEFVVKPTVTRVEAHSVAIVWVTEPNSKTSDVVVHPSDGGAEQRVSPKQSVPPFRDTKSAKTELDYVQNIAVVKELQPSTRYRYTVTGSNTAEGALTGEFTTSPLPATGAPFRFCVTSDTHGGHSAIAEALGEIRPDFVVIAGDFISGKGDDWKNWIAYFDSSWSYRQASPIIPVIGGHDIRPDRNFRALFGLDDPDGGFPSDEASYFSFVYGNLRCIILDQYAKGSAMKAQMQWLEEVLAAKPAEWTMAFFHEPVFAVGSRGGMNGRTDFVDLFERYQVDIVVAGHNHVYERLLPIGPPGKKPVHYVTVNGKGNFRVIRPSPVLVGGIGQRVHCFADFQVKGNRLTMHVRQPDGQVIDQLELVKQAGMYQPEINALSISKELARSIAHIYSAGGKPEGMYVRKDIAIDFPSVPIGGVPMLAKLDTSTFPSGGRIHILPSTEANQWTPAAGVFDVAGSNIAFELVPPDQLKVGKGGFQPAISLRMNVEYQGRVFDATTVNPTLGTQITGLLAARAAEGIDQ